MAVWPASLPQSFLVQSLSFNRQKGSIKFQSDVGPGITRRTSSANSLYFKGQMHMTPEQYDTAEAFYLDTLAQASLSFDWVHPIKQTAVTMRFDISQDDDLQVVGIIRPDKWLIQMAFEILP